jgi:hypothetical protein
MGEAGDSTGTRIYDTTHPAYSIGVSGEDWTLGRLSTNSYYSGYYFEGQMDEVLISKTARYSGPTYTIPTAPYAFTTLTKTDIYVRDGDGAETKLT